MRRHVLKGGISLLLILLFISVATVSAAQTTGTKNALMVTGGILYVGGSGPGNYTKIQDAIDNALEGDTVFVYDDSSPYSEHVLVEKTIHLVGENKETTVVDGKISLTVLTIKADGVTLSGFTIQHSGVLWINSGIEIRSSYNTISGNIISQNFNGITIFPSFNHNNITGNTIASNNGSGIYLYDSQYNVFMDNTISDCDTGGIVLELSEYNNVSTNVFFNDGIVILGYYQNTVMNNIVNGKPLVFLVDKSDMNIDEAGQVVLFNCHNITIQNCNLSNTSIGIYIGYSDDCCISRNSISTCRYGIIFTHSNRNNISLNNIVNNYFGISFNICDFNVIMDNTISFNKYWGIALDYSQNNTISTNDIKNNGGLRRIQRGYGVRLINSSYTKVSHNNFVLNAFNLYPISSPFCAYNENYWNRPRILPKLILGVKPWVQFDWHPAQKPYDITGMT